MLYVLDGSNNAFLYVSVQCIIFDIIMYGYILCRIDPQDIVQAFKFVFVPKRYKHFIRNENKENYEKIINQIHIKDAKFEKFYKSLRAKQEFGPFPQKNDFVI